MSQAANYAKQKGNRLYTCAIDASKAFDKVSRPHLWLKLIDLKIEPEFILTIINYYEESYMLVQVGEKFSKLFRTLVGVRQGGALSPKLFSIFVDALLKEIETAKLGIKIGKMSISTVMYADDLMIMSELKINVKKMLSIIELFGQTNGMKFNPEKTELIVFNFTVKRTLKVRMKDMWQEGLELGGCQIKQTNTIKYLGSILSDDLNNFAHINNRKTASFLALTKIKDFGFDSVIEDCQLKGKMFKIYLRTILTYGVENCNLTKKENIQIKKTDGSLLKKQLGLSRACYTTEIMRSLDIELTEEKIKIIKLKFYQRLLLNKFTKDLLNELGWEKVKDCYHDEIRELLKPAADCNSQKNELSLNDLIKVTLETIKHYALYASQDPTVKTLKKIFKIKRKESVPAMIEFLMNNNRETSNRLFYFIAA